MGLKPRKKYSLKALAFVLLFCTFVLIFFYHFSVDSAPESEPKPILNRYRGASPETWTEPEALVSPFSQCSALTERETDITTWQEFSKFDFRPTWMSRKHFWTDSLESQYKNSQQQGSKPPLKVILVPHSHNDPGWLKTFAGYFEAQTRVILNNVVAGMTHKYPNMTFIWSEISFLQLWWDQAKVEEQQMLRDLVDSGRFEITTGGWVMTDSANVHLYAMLDQLIEGHQWLQSTLGVTPTSGWSIDPFGEGATLPYLLASSGFKGAVIQRLHFAWKNWFAWSQKGDFDWMPGWQVPGDERSPRSLLTHNMPFDIYSIKATCGPHQAICEKFDFRKTKQSRYYSRFSFSESITADNVQRLASSLMEEYSRTASLFPHNVALVPIGDDFRYDTEDEVERQYSNYQKLIDHISSHRASFQNAEVGFGTPRDYFEAIRERMDGFPSLKGDFFPYSDIFSTGTPAYWTGYFTTRPQYKILSRQLEANLRSAEIIFTLARSSASNFERLVRARRNLGLFQHHDAITGTAKEAVMADYGRRLFESLQDVVEVQRQSIEGLLRESGAGFLEPDSRYENFSRPVEKLPISVSEGKSAFFVVYNSLAQDRHEVVSFRTKTPHLRVTDPNDVPVELQVSPLLAFSTDKINVSSEDFEVEFVYKLPALSVTTFKVSFDPQGSQNVAKVFYEGSETLPQPITLENSHMKLLFDQSSGFLASIKKKDSNEEMNCSISIGAYRSVPRMSGAYLFRSERKDCLVQFLESYRNSTSLAVIQGRLSSQVVTFHGSFLRHSVKLFRTGSELDYGLQVQNDLELTDKHKFLEVFMKVSTDLKNGDPPEFFSDLNGFQYQRRVKTPDLSVEGNFYPITQSAFIQDEKHRLTLLTSHAQGAASLEPGELKIMLDRRPFKDDNRGMGEGIKDNRLTQQSFWLTLEEISGSKSPDSYQVPSSLAHVLSDSLNYRPHLFFLRPETSDVGLKKQVLLASSNFPCDLHLLNLRTLPEPDAPSEPSLKALMVLHRRASDCSFTGSRKTMACTVESFPEDFFSGHLKVDSVSRTSLTGIHSGQKLALSEIKLAPMELKTFSVVFSGEKRQI